MFRINNFVEMIEKYLLEIEIQINLCTIIPLGTPILWLLLKVGRCSEDGLFYQDSYLDSKSGRYSEVVRTGLTVICYLSTAIINVLIFSYEINSEEGILTFV